MFSPFDLAYSPDCSLGFSDNDKWPLFDITTHSAHPSASSSAASQGTPPTPALGAIPIPPSRSPRNKNPDHIPRPRNAFMIYRSAFAAEQKITPTIEHDNRHITRIIAHCWNNLPEAEKQVWRDKAAAEKVQHAERYPHYRFSPVGRANRPVKRKVRRNGVEDVKRCEKLAELVMAGKVGQELERAVKNTDNERLAAAHVVDDGACQVPPVPSDVPLLCSPLSPPEVLECQDSTAGYVDIVELPTFNYPPAVSDTGMDSSLQPPYYQPNTYTGPNLLFDLFSLDQPDSFVFDL